ncbi:MAG: type II/IV secretion system ATPase subunit, partial [Candidatus Thermoplasmatota archaeon]|nr:type II/IV secretion system ATPase subunit [Candidatus Thermoplasmatota archaeon]
MSKKNKKTNYNDISKIEKLVDEIILKNKGKLEQTVLNSIDSKKFPPGNTKEKSIFYFKENKNNKQDTSHKLSTELISKARKNLSEKPLDKKSYEITPELELEHKVHRSKPKTRIRIRKKNRVNENTEKIQKTDDRLISKEFDTVISKIKKTFIPGNVHNKDEEFKFLDKKIKNKKEEKTLNPRILNTTEKNATDFWKKHNFLDKKSQKLINNNKKNVLEKIKKDEDNFSNDLDDDLDLLGQDIKKLDEKDENAGYKKETEESKVANKKKMFFKKNISNKQTENIKNEYFGIKPTLKTRFKVDNLPNLKDDEKIIIDEGIKKTGNNATKTNDLKKVEEKVNKLFKEHINDIGERSTEISDEKNHIDTKITSAGSTDSKQEHVFFDEQEQESDFSGWSSNVSDKERKELKDISGEIKNKSIGEINNIELPKEVLSIKSVKLSDLGFSENEWDELDFYPLVEPYVYVEIIKERETTEKCYFLVEDEMSEEEMQTMNFIYDTIRNMAIDTEDFETKGDSEYLIENVMKVIKDYNLNISTESYNKILYNLSKLSIGLGKIDPLMHDPNIEDISCDGNGVPLFLYHSKFGSLKSNILFDTADDLNSFVHKLAQKCGKQISIAEPMLDATMPDGSRIQMTLSDEITKHGSTFTIRKFRADPFSPSDLLEFNTMNSEMIAYMWIAVENGINMLFAGGTASGKTTTLNALSLFIPAEAKIVSIEETREINLPHPNWIPGVVRTGFGQVVADKLIGEIDTYDLMKAALRQRPEYIIVGEIRGREAYVLFQAMSTGHTTYST